MFVSFLFSPLLRAQPGALDMTFDPSPNAPVRALAVQSDGRLIVSGDFGLIGAKSRNRLARLNPDGSVDESFDAGSGPNGSLPFAIALQSDDKVLLGGGFTDVNGTPRLALARLLTNGGVDPGFVQHDSAGSNVFFPVYSVASVDSGRVVASGQSFDAGDASTARFNSDGGLDPTYDPAVDPNPFALRQSDGKRLVVDSTADFIRRFNPDGSPDSSFTSIQLGGGEGPPSGELSNITAIAVQPNDKILVATLYQRSFFFGIPTHVFRLEKDGDRDNGFTPAAVGVSGRGEVRAMTVQPDGGIVIGGDFTAVNGMSRSGLARLIGDDPAAKPQIIVQPVNQAAPFGGAASFMVTVSSGEIPTYKWRFNGGDIPDGTNAVLRLTNLRLDQAGNYTVIVRNSHGSSESNSARLDVWPANCPGPSFGIPLPVSTGAIPPGVVVADFNRDGKSDIAMFDSGATNVLIRLGIGDRSFQPPIGSPVGGVGTLMVTGDFNGDGRSDLMVVTGFYTPGGVSVLLGNGDGTFESPVQTISESVDWAPVSAAVADLNGDGKLDLAVAHYLVGNSRGVSVYLGRGDGRLAPGVRYITGAPEAVWIGLFGVLPPQGNCSVSAADVNGDGRVDLIFTNPGRGVNPETNQGVQGSVSVLLGNSDGSFGAPLLKGLPAYPYAAALSDFNRDGKADLVVVGYDTPTFFPPSPISGAFVLPGNGDGTFQDAVNYSAGGSPVAVTTGDFNSDHQRDIAIATQSGVSVLLGNGNGTFQPAVNLGLPSQIVAVADFNGDGLPDILEASAVMLNTCIAVEPAVRISCETSNSTLKISWPARFTTFILESALSPNATNWQTVAESPTTYNGQFQVTVPLDQTERYFRLREL